MTSESKTPKKIVDYLPADEEVTGRHQIGSLDFITTTERLICMRRFPPLFLEVHYKDITGIEHRSEKLWRDLAYAIILITLGAAVFLSGAEGFRTYIPQWSISFDLMIATASTAAAAIGVYHLIKFIPSLNGHIRVSRREMAPVKIPANMSPELQSLIADVDRLAKEHAQNQKSPQMAENAPEPGWSMASDKEMMEKLKVQLNDVADSKVMLISSKSENHGQVVSTVLSNLIKQRDMGGVYISITEPYDFILSTITAAGIPSDDIYFIDPISIMAGKTHEQGNDRVKFIENPSSLEDVSLFIDKMLPKVRHQKKFLVLDSLSSLLIYNTDKSVREFTHFIINKIRLENISGVILSIEKKDAEDLVKTLTPMCDMEFRC